MPNDTLKHHHYILTRNFHHLRVHDYWKLLKIIKLVCTVYPSKYRTIIKPDKRLNHEKNISKYIWRIIHIWDLNFWHHIDIP